VDVDTAGSAKRRAIKAFHTLAIVLKARLLDNEKKKVVLYPRKPLGSKYEEPPFMKISFLSLES
jgi:hypothetical protein